MKNALPLWQMRPKIPQQRGHQGAHDIKPYEAKEAISKGKR